VSRRVAVIGHVEWVEFARVDHVPAPGELVAATEAWEEAAGGAAIAAVQARKLGAEVDFFTVVGDDDHGRLAVERFRALGLHVHAVARERQRRGWIHLDDTGERTITVMGERSVPSAEDPLPWERLEGAEAVYFTGGDPGALRAARRAKRLVATPRAGDTLRDAGVKLDVLVRSANDPGERHAGEDLVPPPHLIVSTGGAEGGRWVGEDKTTGAWQTAPLPGPRRDAYGAGDSFAGGLTYALGAGLDTDAALALAARCGAHKLTGRAGFDRQLTAAEA
jgi:ribokinase